MPAVVSDSTSPPNTSTSVSLRTQHVRLDLLAGVAPRRRRARDREQISARAVGCALMPAVPPTVISRTSSVGCPDDTGHALTVLAAHAGPGVEVVADDVDHAQHFGTVADQLRGADRVGDLAVLDQVRLGDAEHEVAGRGFDLAAAELRAVEAVLDAADDVVGIGRRPRAGTCSSCAPSAGAR